MDSHQLIQFYKPLPAALEARLVGDPYPVPVFPEDAADSLKGFRAALLTTHGPELPEFHIPVTYLRERGASVEVLTQDWLFDAQEGDASGMIVLAQWFAASVVVKADKRVSVANVKDYDAVILIGGAWNPIMLRSDNDVLRFVREAHARNLLVAAICHGPQVLISTEAFPKGTRATGVDDIKLDLKNAGFAVEDKPVVYDDDQRLLTSPNPGCLQAFCERLGEYALHFISTGRSTIPGAPP